MNLTKKELIRFLEVQRQTCDPSLGSHSRRVYRDLTGGLISWCEGVRVPQT